jgi:hypothetical protein
MITGWGWLFVFYTALVWYHIGHTIALEKNEGENSLKDGE